MMTKSKDFKRGRSSGISRRAGFTLTELLVVAVIIGILLGFIMKASFEGLRSANEATTQALIQRLDAAMSERMEALMSVSVYPSVGENVLAGLFAQNMTRSLTRSQAIAQYDFMKSEVPDVFFIVQPASASPNYRLNFASVPYPDPTDSSADESNYILPLGAGVESTDPDYPLGTGIFGASYAAAAGIYKNLGFLPTGYDGVDNNRNNLIDEWIEGVNTTNLSVVNKNLANHTHKTARSEMLYAVLVEGQGPLGSSFSPDDFTPREVADTDGDGLPEFIDAWGEPLQFYRWPIFYSSDLQRGFPKLDTVGPYYGMYDVREQDPLDPGLSLVTPSWLLSGQNISGNLKDSFNSDPDGNLSQLPTPGDSRISKSAWAFQLYFHTLVEPLSLLKGPLLQQSTGILGNPLWDRTTNPAFADYSLRRSYFTKFLILSGGPDKVPGVAQLGFDYRTLGSISDGSGAPVAITAANILQIENGASQIDPNQWNTKTGLPGINPNSAATQDPQANGTTYYLQKDAGLDDISNHRGQFAAGSTQ
jgi:prepilin-type N-terminal cleavage/methylation domain-containing protein